MASTYRKTTKPPNGMLRLGVCCQFEREPIKFRATTATAMLRLSKRERLARLAELSLGNAEALLASLEFCADHGIGAFRINGQILPVKTHPTAGYEVTELPGSQDIIACFQECGAFAREHKVRLSFHPDQFVVINSPNPKTLAHSLAELNYQAEVAAWVGADTLNIHGGGAGATLVIGDVVGIAAGKPRTAVLAREARELEAGAQFDDHVLERAHVAVGLDDRLADRVARALG